MPASTPKPTKAPVVYPQHLQGNDTSPDVLAGCIVPIVVASMVVLARFYSRRLIKSWGWDDTTILVSWILSIATVSLVGIETRYGLGHQRKNIPVTFQTIAIKISYGTLITYQLALISTKISILFFYLRILKLEMQRKLIFGTMAFVGVYGSVLVAFSAVVCNPLTGKRGLTIGTCYNYYPILTASAVLHAATDVWLIGLILPHVVSMTLPRRQKIGLGIVLTLGLFDACASLTRMSVAHRFLNPKLAQWDSLSFAVWTTLEASLGVMCASIPMLRPLARVLMGRKPGGKVEIVGNVKRSGNGAPMRVGQDSLWEGDINTRPDLEMACKGSGFLTVAEGVTKGDSGSERTASFSTGKTAVNKVQRA